MNEYQTDTIDMRSTHNTDEVVCEKGAHFVSIWEKCAGSEERIAGEMQAIRFSAWAPTGNAFRLILVHTRNIPFLKKVVTEPMSPASLFVLADPSIASDPSDGLTILYDKYSPYHTLTMLEMQNIRVRKNSSTTEGDVVFIMLAKTDEHIIYSYECKWTVGWSLIRSGKIFKEVKTWNEIGEEGKDRSAAHRTKPQDPQDRAKVIATKENKQKGKKQVTRFKWT